ncbi:hypothetical protein BH10ACI1_BH10ACI1_29910 [soil metagenome]
MNGLQPQNEATRKDLFKDKALKIGALSLPIGLPLVLVIIFFLLSLFASAWFIPVAIISLIGGFFVGLIGAGALLFYRSRWLGNLRERLAVDGIKAKEVQWFMHELSGAEKRSLKEVEAKNLLLGDAFRETLAARLTSTRILKSVNKEIMLVQRRQNKLKYLKSGNIETFQKELNEDAQKLTKIRSEAEEMRVEAENRLMMIERASKHGTNFSETEFTLKKLSDQSAQLPLALESARMEEEIRRELEKEKE